jgi:hypothetical protein
MKNAGRRKRKWQKIQQIHRRRSPNRPHQRSNQPCQGDAQPRHPGPTFMTEHDELITANAGLQMRQATDVAGVCAEIVKKTAINIQGKRYVKVEGWMAIATAYGCVAGATNVQQVLGGVAATGELRKISDGTLVATAEGFVGEDEPTWFGGNKQVRDKTSQTGWVTRDMPSRAMYAIRAMAQTRAISRVCRSAFAHVVVLIDSNLSTTPAEEIPDGGFHDYTQPSDEEITARQENREKESANAPKDAMHDVNMELLREATKKPKKT